MMTEDRPEVTRLPNGSPARALRDWGFAVSTGLVIFAIGMSGGGYELPASGEVVILAAWLLMIGSILGVVPESRPSGAAAWAAGFLVLLVGWSLISIGWSDAAGRSVAVAVQYGAVLATLLFGMFIFRAEDRNPVLAGILGGAAAIAMVAVESRFHPGLAPEPSNPAQAARMQARLHWPVGYWNTLGFLAAMVVPIAIHFASDARRALSRAASAATIPVLSLCVLFTLSRGSIIVVAFGLAVGLALGPVTVRRGLTVVASLAAAAILVTEAVSRRALMDGLTSRGPGVGQASDVETLLFVVAVGLGGLCAASGFLPQRLREPGRPMRLWLRGVACLLVAGVGVAAVLGAGQGPRIERAWNDFRDPQLQVDMGKSNSLERLSAQGSSGRWQLWEGAIDEGNTKPWTGTGAGTFELWWTRNSTEFMTVRNAHSQYLEVYAELGFIGVLLIAGFVIALLAGCLLAIRRSAASADLGAVSAGSATLACFAFSTAFDWGWQVTVLPVVAMLAATAVVATGRGAREVAASDTGADGETEPTPGEGEGAGMGARVESLCRLLAGLIAVALLALAIPPVVATHSITESQRDVRNGDPVGALQQANAAVEWQPYSAAAWLQRGLVYDSIGDSADARTSVRKAIDREPGSWRNWLALAGVEARDGNVKASLRAYRRARELNPNSPLFAIGN